MAGPRIPASRKYWLDLALFYCSRRETSRSRLRSYFQRKIREYRIPEEQVPAQLVWIDSVLDECESKRIIDHDRYAGILLGDLQRRGKGRRYIEQKMKEKGLGSRIAEIGFEPEREQERAEMLARKLLERASMRKLGEDPDCRRELRQKLLQKLVASGFELGTAKKAVEMALTLP